LVKQGTLPVSRPGCHENLTGQVVHSDALTVGQAMGEGHGHQHFLTGQLGDLQSIVVKGLGGQAEIDLACAEKASHGECG
jgi:hypothetical protein